VTTFFFGKMNLSTMLLNMRPVNPIHPGQMLLEEFWVPANTSQRAFATRLGWTVAKLNELIKGKRGITADSALDLAAALKTSPELWLNLQMYYDLARAQARRRKAS
jgi:antitoxin HigA-1